MTTTAIVTNEFKHQLLGQILDEVGDSATSDYYYVGIGRSDQWNASELTPTALNTENEQRKFRSSLQSIIRCTDASYIVPRFNWTSGTIYSAYSDDKTAAENTDFYVLSENNRIYLCLQQGKDSGGTSLTSTVDPETTGASTTPVSTDDGYVWKYMTTLTANQANKFLSSTHVPVATVDSSTSMTAAQSLQNDVQNASSQGEIVGYRIVSAGAGYGSAPTMTIQGNGTGARATAVVSTAGGVSRVTVDESDGTFLFGSGYTQASIKLTGGNPTTPAEIQPIISNRGVGKNLPLDLGADGIMFNVKPAGDQDGSWLTDQNFRQIGIIKNPISSDLSNFTGDDAQALRRLNIGSVVGFDSSSAKDTIIEGLFSGARAYVDGLDGNTFIYHQTEETGFHTFDSGEVVFDTSDSGNTASILSDSEGAIQLDGGEIVYIENRSPVERDPAQTEDIKIILQL